MHAACAERVLSGTAASTSSRHAACNAEAPPAHSMPQHFSRSSTRALSRLTARASTVSKPGRSRQSSSTCPERSRSSSSSFSAPAPVGDGVQGLPLDLRYMQEVYADAWQQQAGSHPEWVGRNKSILQRLHSLGSIQQVQHLVESELASMSGITVALVMLKAAVQLRPKNPQGRYYSMAQLIQQQHHHQHQGISVPEEEESADTFNMLHAGGNSIKDSSSSFSSREHSSRVGDGSRRAAARVQQTQALHQQLAWLRRAPNLVRQLLLHMASLPAHQVSLPCVAIALQSLAVVTERGLPLTTPECTAVQALMGHMRGDLFVATPEQLAQLAHGLCFARVTPPEGWLADFSKAALSKMSLMTNFQLGFIAHALGRQGYVPDEFWLSVFASETAPKLFAMQPRQLSNTLWAVAQWGVDPGDEWRDAACAAVAAKLQELPPACLASALCSLQAICPSLPLTWLAAVVARLVELAPHTSLRQDCEVLAALASLTYMPDQSSMAAYVGAMQPKLAWATPSELAICLRSLARLHFLPTRAWLHDWVAAAHRQVRGFQAEETANTLACFATWKVKPPRDFMQDLYELSASQARQDAFPPYFATRMLCALATLRLAPPRQVLWALLHVLGSEALVARNELVGVKHSSSMVSQPHTTTASGNEDGARDRACIAAALANAFAALPYLLRCYNIQQLAGLAGSSATGGSVAVVGSQPAAWEIGGGLGSPSVSDSSSNGSIDTSGNSSGSNSSSNGASSVGAWGAASSNGRAVSAVENGRGDTENGRGGGGAAGPTVNAAGGVYVKAGGSPEQLNAMSNNSTTSNNSSSNSTDSTQQGVDARGSPSPPNTGSLQASSSSAFSSSSSSPSPSDRLPKEAAALLLPRQVIGPFLAVLARRLGRLQPRHLCALACALVELQLYPGRGFLLAHVSAVAAQLPRMDTSEKRCLHACYTALNRK